MKPYIRVSGLVTARDLESFSEICWEEQTLGLQESPGDPWCRVSAYFGSERSPSNLLEVLLRVSRERGLRLQHLTAELFDFDPDQWLQKWRESFTAFPVGTSFFVHPPWEPASIDFPINLEIEPGRAFGTGTHESTQLCLTALEQVAREPETVLDVGTGSGILAMAAARSFPRSRVTALDIDPMATEMARENLERNALPGIHLVTGGVEAIRGRFELVVANLTLPIFRQVASGLISLIGRDLIVSGFTHQQGSAVRQLFEPRGVGLQAQWELRDWHCYRLRRP